METDFYKNHPKYNIQIAGLTTQKPKRRNLNFLRIPERVMKLHAPRFKLLSEHGEATERWIRKHAICVTATLHMRSTPFTRLSPQLHPGKAQEYVVDKLVCSSGKMAQLNVMCRHLETTFKCSF